MSDGTRQDAIPVSADTVFTQMCKDLRSYRDHERTVSIWFTSIFLAVLAAIVGGKYAAAGSPLGVALERCASLKWCLAALSVLLSLYAAWSIADAMRQAGILRKWMTDHLEPKSNNLPADQSCCGFLQPGILLCALLIFLGIFIAILIIHKPSVISG